MGMPLVVKATFMLSGMLGLKLEGLVDSNGQPRSVEASMPFNITNGTQTSMIEMLYSEPGEIDRAICGPGRCGENYVCVTWIKENANVINTRRSRESPMMVHECLPDDGNHYTKMDPSGEMLCSKDEIPIIIRQPQHCLKNKPPCNLVWKYRCVQQSEKSITSHSCKWKMCPSRSLCFELVECDLSPPCVTKAVCVKGGSII